MYEVMAAKLNQYELISLFLKVPYTSLMLILAMVAYWVVQGPPVEPKTPFEFVGNLLRHQDIFHLGLNLFVIAYTASYCESVKGGPFMLALAVGTLMAGSIAEYLLVDGRFIGLSAGAYGLAAWMGINVYAIAAKKLFLVAFFFIAIIAAGYPDTAIVAHTSGALIGGIVAMLGNLFKKKKPTASHSVQADTEQSRYILRPMAMNDIPDAVKIIAMTDEDDAREAEQNLSDRRCQGMFVLEEAGRMIGMTGYYKADDVQNICWLSWTYLEPSAQGQGAGKYMVNELLCKMDNENIRKLFIASSDYQEDGEHIYDAAHAFYESLEANKEVQVDDYHDSDEAMIIYGLRNQRYDTAKAQKQGVVYGVDFTAIHPAEESINGYEIQWTSSSETQDVTGLDNCIAEAKRQNARILMVTLPEDIANFATPSLMNAGFVNCGILEDYYDKGLGQVYWILSTQHLNTVY
jgi:GNAT superfamily N-acetyltransferase/membrane associated rhomboid family serine protease